MDDLGYEHRELGGELPPLTEIAAEKIEEAKETYRKIRQETLEKAAVVDAFVRERPYAAVGLAVLAGLVLSRIFLSQGPKVIYVKPRKSQV